VGAFLGRGVHIGSRCTALSDKVKTGAYLTPSGARSNRRDPSLSANNYWTDTCRSCGTLRYFDVVFKIKIKRSQPAAAPTWVLRSDEG
jgi:hypothetical protein